MPWQVPYIYADNDPNSSTDESGLQVFVPHGPWDACPPVAIGHVVLTVGSCIVVYCLLKNPPRVEIGPIVCPMPTCPQTKRGWNCTAKCSSRGPTPPCGNYYYGSGSGQTQAEPCRAAKAVAVISASVGGKCHPGHCQCTCTQF